MNPGTQATFELVKGWDEDHLKTTLEDALRVSMDVLEKTGQEACGRMIVMMSKAAMGETPIAQRKRTLMMDVWPHGEYVEVFDQAGRIYRLYKWMFTKKAQEKNRLRGTWSDAQKIGNRGLAQRSWLWGLGKLGQSSARSAIPGTSRLYQIKEGAVRGYVKENRLSYISKIMRQGWENVVERKAINGLMKYVSEKIGPWWGRGDWARKGKAA